MAESGRGPIGDDSLEDWELLGSGGFGFVFKATHKLLGIGVAIKVLNCDDSSGKLYAALCREAGHMEDAEQFVPRVYGMYRGRPPWMGKKEVQGIVMELMEGGCLESFLLTKTESKPPPWPLAFRLAHQVALAMDFLHCKKDLVHMDLKPANILLDADLNAKIADFGLSTVSNSVKSTNRTNKGGTASYTPPEGFDDKYHRVRSYDVYSYGILLHTILTGESPYPAGLSRAMLKFHITRGQRPELFKIDFQKAAGLDELVELMQRCWDSEPNKRPSFGECVEVTRGVFSRHEEGISAACDLLRPPPVPVPVPAPPPAPGSTDTLTPPPPPVPVPVPAPPPAPRSRKWWKITKTLAPPPVPVPAPPPAPGSTDTLRPPPPPPVPAPPPAPGSTDTLTPPPPPVPVPVPAPPPAPGSTDREAFLKHSSPLSLDPNTAFRKLLLSENNRKVTWTDVDQRYADNPKRFTFYPNVLSKECISDLFYFEVEWSGGEVGIALCQDDVSRTGGLSGFGYSPESWELYYSDSYKRYRFLHNRIVTEVSGPVPSTRGSHRVGVYIDPPAGVLCFYDVCGNTMSLIRTERTTFTRPLYAGLGVYLGSTAEVCEIW